MHSHGTRTSTCQESKHKNYAKWPGRHRVASSPQPRPPSIRRSAAPRAVPRAAPCARHPRVALRSALGPAAPGPAAPLRGAWRAPVAIRCAYGEMKSLALCLSGVRSPLDASGQVVGRFHPPAQTSRRLLRVTQCPRLGAPAEFVCLACCIVFYIYIYTQYVFTLRLLAYV